MARRKRRKSRIKCRYGRLKNRVRTPGGNWRYCKKKK